FAGAARLALRTDGPVERVAQSASGVLRPFHRGRRNLRPCRREQLTHLLDGQIGSRIGNSRSVVEKFALQGFNFETTHGWLLLVVEIRRTWALSRKSDSMDRNH